jgi:hypothetical protein
MAVAAAESFINELSDFSEAMPWAAPESKRLGELLPQVEADRGSLLLKWHVAALALSGEPFDRGMQPFQDFTTVVTLRNWLAHPKPRDEMLLGIEGDRVAFSIRPHKLMENLAQRGFVSSTPMNWLLRLQSPDIAEWACETVRAMVHALCDRATDADDVPGLDNALRPEWGYPPKA